MRSLVGMLSACCFLLVGWSLAGASEAEVGKVVALRGSATVERAETRLEARVNTGILPQDSIRTAAASRAKLLFIDDSVLTLGENASLVVREFLDGKGEPGRSIFNLLDGKMRAVVGRTRFEVQTPTAVAAARGTVIFFEVGIEEERDFTSIVCLEGEVLVWLLGAEAADAVLLTPGTMVKIRKGEALPKPTQAPEAVLKGARTATSAGPVSELERLEMEWNRNQASKESGGAADNAARSEPVAVAAGFAAVPFSNALPPGPVGLNGPGFAGPALPPIPQQPLKPTQPTRVDINISLPTGPSP